MCAPDRNSDFGKITTYMSEFSLPRVDPLIESADRKRVHDALFEGSADGLLLGHYSVQGMLGLGGMGLVFEAHDQILDRPVALKVMRREFGTRHAKRLRREARALAKISHPNVVQVYGVDQIENFTFLVMELVDGSTLRDWMRRRSATNWRQCVEVFVQAGEGLSAVHDRGLVHRDFKPSNVIIDGNGRVRVLDFGLARRVERSEQGRSSVHEVQTERDTRLDLQRPLTHEGALVGTPAYMAPEQLRGLEADARSDQFSFCLAMYEALYGERPFSGNTPAACLVSMNLGHVAEGSRPVKVPTRLRRILLRGLSLDPQERWPTMDALLTKLRRCIVPPKGRHGLLSVAALVVGMLVGNPLGDLLGFSDPEERHVRVESTAKIGFMTQLRTEPALPSGHSSPLARHSRSGRWSHRNADPPEPRCTLSTMSTREYGAEPAATGGAPDDSLLMVGPYRNAPLQRPAGCTGSDR